MTKTVDFYIDFGSPNAWLVHQVIPEIEARTGATFNYIPVLLGGIFKATGNQPPWLAFQKVPVKIQYEQKEIERFIKKHKLFHFKMNPNFPVNTVMLMRGAVAAEQMGILKDYVSAGTKAMWEDGLKMDDPEIFVKTFTEVGLDGAAILAATQDQAVKDKLKDNTQAAVERGVFGIPTFFVGDEMFFGKERLGQIEDLLTGEKQ